MFQSYRCLACKRLKHYSTDVLSVKPSVCPMCQVKAERAMSTLVYQRSLTIANPPKPHGAREESPHSIAERFAQLDLF